MSILIEEKDLPNDLTPEQAVESAYAAELAEVVSRLRRGLPVLIECDKDLSLYVYMNLRSRLKQANLQCVLIDGRQRAPDPQGIPLGFLATMIGQIRDAVRGAIEKKVLVLAHLDLLA